MSLNKRIFQSAETGLLGAVRGPLNTIIDFDGGIAKSASSGAFSPADIAQHAPDKSHFLMHVIAMGDYETYGQNKNGDAWTKQANKTYHPTFVKYGHFFREHNNSDPKFKIGLIKASAYNEDMHRIELLIWGDKKLAEEEYTLAKSGSELSFSMSAKLPYDVCSCCGNKASSPRQYCDHLKYHMNQYLPEFRKYAFAYNPHPKFFDISRVKRPADRIAHYIEYVLGEDDELKKSAAAHGVLGGAQLAEAMGDKDDGGHFHPLDLGLEKQALLYRLAAHEQAMSDPEFWKNASEKAEFAKLVPLAYKEQLSPKALDTLRTISPDVLFREMAKRASILPFLTFAAYVHNFDPADKSNVPDFVKEAACFHLSDIFSRLAAGECDCEGLTHAFDASPEIISGMCGNGKDEVQKFMDEVEQKFSARCAPVRNRVVRVTIIKAANEEKINKVLNTDSSKAKAIATAYALYKLAALNDMASFGHEIGEVEEIIAVGTNRDIFH
jgi:hypothetical protein